MYDWRPTMQQTARHLAEQVRGIRAGEEAKIAVRGIRQQARKQIESLGRGSIRGVQEATDAAIEEIERVIKTKVAELT
jgi:ribosome recycling factor